MCSSPSRIVTWNGVVWVDGVDSRRQTKNRLLQFSPWVVCKHNKENCIIWRKNNKLKYRYAVPPYFRAHQVAYFVKMKAIIPRHTLYYLILTKFDWKNFMNGIIRTKVINDWLAFQNQNLIENYQLCHFHHSTIFCSYIYWYAITIFTITASNTFLLVVKISFLKYREFSLHSRLTGVEYMYAIFKISQARNIISIRNQYASQKLFYGTKYILRVVIFLWINLNTFGSGHLFPIDDIKKPIEIRRFYA